VLGEWTAEIRHIGKQRREIVAQLTAEQAYMLVQNALLGTIRNESRTTKSVLAAVPNVNLDYRPDPCAKSADELLRHIAVADNFFLEAVINGVFDPQSVAIPPELKSPTEIADWYERTYARNFASVSALPGEALVKSVDFRGMFQRPAYFFLQLGLVHTVHHRGQLSTYLRPMGSKVPAIYGESYDTAAAKKAAIQAQA
jgi:uncharacterized damage-inducible protein DinB